MNRGISYQTQTHIDGALDDTRLVRDHTLARDLTDDVLSCDEALEACGATHFLDACVGDVTDGEDVRCARIIGLEVAVHPDHAGG